MGRDRFAELRRVCRRAVADGVVPGLVVQVTTEGRALFHEAFGHRQLRPRALPATRATIYDVASLTKAAVTSLLALQLVAEGRLGLDDLVVRHVPRFRGRGKGRVTLRHLLAHASGLPAHRPFWEQTGAAPSQRFAIENLAAREPLIYQPGSGSLYSDLGFITLGWLVEKVGGARLDQLAASRLFEPLGMASARFVNRADPRARAALLAARPVAATQRCPVRRRLVVGEVDDLNAWAMGGIAGHAGLFCDAEDLGRLCAALAADWQGARRGGPARVVEGSMLRLAFARAGVPRSTWRLGWDGPAALGSLAGTRLARTAVGHLGFTGCSLWLDPERATSVVVLCNRVHPVARDDARFRLLRPALNDAALAGAGYRV